MTDKKTEMEQQSEKERRSSSRSTNCTGGVVVGQQAADIVERRERGILGPEPGQAAGACARTLQISFCASSCKHTQAGMLI